MLYGQFPFYDSMPQELFRKIKAAEYSIPEWAFIFRDLIKVITLKWHFALLFFDSNLFWYNLALDAFAVLQ